MKHQDILNFWFSEEISKKHWIKDENFDAEIREKFSSLHKQAIQGELNEWEENAESSLALVILLDQFSRNMFRGKPEAFSTDAQSLRVAKNAVSKGFDKNLKDDQRAFFYLPYMHSENIEDQKECVRLFAGKDTYKKNHNFALAHLEVIEKYGRFPHRNKILGRENTPEEEIYLQDPNAGF